MTFVKKMPHGHKRDALLSSSPVPPLVNNEEKGAARERVMAVMW